jgi:hypothetical protein
MFKSVSADISSDPVSSLGNEARQPCVEAPAALSRIVLDAAGWARYSRDQAHLSGQKPFERT